MNDDRKIPRVGYLLPPYTPESHTITEMFKNVKFPPAKPRVCFFFFLRPFNNPAAHLLLLYPPCNILLIS